MTLGNRGQHWGGFPGLFLATAPDSWARLGPEVPRAEESEHDLYLHSREAAEQVQR